MIDRDGAIVGTTTAIILGFSIRSQFIENLLYASQNNDLIE